MKIGDCVTRDGLRTSLVLLGIGLLTAACGGGGGSGSGDEMPEEAMPVQMPEQEAMPVNGGGSMNQLGEWNDLMPGGLDVSDVNSLLRAYYDSSGGHVEAGAPVQPEGTGTATWTGMWSGKIPAPSPRRRSCCCFGSVFRRRGRERPPGAKRQRGRHRIL